MNSKAGYDGELDLARGRGFIFSIHATCKIAVSRIPVDPELLEEAIEQPIVKFGKQKVYDGGKVLVFELRSGYNGVSLAVQNLHDTSIQVSITVKAVNALSHTGSLKATQVIRQGQVEVLHHIMPIKDEKWSWGYSIEWKRLAAMQEVAL